MSSCWRPRRASSTSCFSAAACVFEYVPRLRSDHDEHFHDVAAVLAGERQRVRQLHFEPGCLNLVRGYYAMHRVTPVIGKRRRLQTVFAFADEPGKRGDVESSILLYGPRVAEVERQRLE